MRTLVFALTFSLSLCAPSFAQHSGHSNNDAGVKPATYVPGMGSHHHPVSTSNSDAQKFFDQGLRFVYAFNHDEAIRSFTQASKLDPTLAMAHWGIALALGPNINLEVDPAREKAAHEAVQKARALAAKAPENERAYIEALARRYSIDPKADLKQLAIDYKNAMGEIVRRYPDDLDAATLYAESAMNLRPWQLWSLDGKPADGTEEIVAVLESVLRRDPNHIGAIHYYIHAIEASPNPERALAYAPKLPALVPAAGHLVHMPAHIYHRTGDYDAASLSNKDAAKADEAYMKAHGGGGFYPAMYYSHNLHFLAIADATAGRFAGAMNAARQLEAHIGPHIKTMLMLEGFMLVSPLILVQFNRWDEIEKLPPPDAGMVGTNAVWHFARGMSFAARGRTTDAEKEYAAFMVATNKVPAGSSFGLNSASKVLRIAEAVLAAVIAENKSPNGNEGLELLNKAIELEDTLAYDEPQAWFLQTRQWLGGALMKRGDYLEAERVFRADLERNKRNGRSLFGLLQSLKAQKKGYAAALVQREFDAAWKNADTRLTSEQFSK